MIKCNIDFLKNPSVYIITDPKGKLLKSCNEMMQKHGYQLKIKEADLNKSDIWKDNNYLHQ